MGKVCMMNGRIVAVAVVAVVLVLVCGCGSGAEDVAEPGVAEGEMGDGLGSGAVGEGGKESMAGRGDKAGEVQNIGGDESTGEVQGTGGGEGAEGVQSIGGNEGAGGVQGGGGNQMDAVSGEQQAVEGIVEEVGEGSFVLALLVSEVDEGSGLVMVGDDPEGRKITVGFSGDTVFTRRVTTDGKTGTVQAGAIEDVKTGVLVSVVGVWSGDVFLAGAAEVFVDAR